jgi:hypothetical protein
MNKIAFLLHEDPGNARSPKEEIQETTVQHQHEINITEGSEFLDDAIRTREQPYDETTIKENE